MTNTISFRNVESLDHLRSFVDHYLDQTIGSFVKNEALRANVVIEKKQIRNHPHGHPDFFCEIVLYHPVLRRPVVAKKSSSNFYKSVMETCKTVEKSLRRLAQTKSKRRHRNYERANVLDVDTLQTIGAIYEEPKL